MNITNAPTSLFSRQARQNYIIRIIAIERFLSLNFFSNYYKIKSIICFLNPIIIILLETSNKMKNKMYEIN